MDVPIMPDQAQTDTPFETTFHLDWTRPPLTMNQRMHWARKAKETKSVRAVAKLHALRLPHFNRIEVTLTWVVPNHDRRRDADNVVPTLKALCDGLVDAGVVDDDTPDQMVKHMPIIRYERGAVAHMELTIREVR